MRPIKRYSMPRHWKLPTKGRKWVVSPVPGPHGKGSCLPLQMVVRDVLKLADNAKEARGLIFQGKILVDKKPRKEAGHPVGLMDVIEIPGSKKSYVVKPVRNGLGLEELKSGNDRKLCKITGKRNVKGGLVQLNLHDGRCMTVKGGKGYSVNDSLLIQLPDQKVLEHIKLAAGAEAIIMAGRNQGSTGRIKETRVRKNMLEKSTATISTKERDILTPMGYIMVTGAKGGRK